MAAQIRAVAYSLLQNPWIVMVFEPLHGISFGLFHSAGVYHSSKIAPTHLSASSQGMFNAVQFGMGSCTAMILGGYLIDQFGAPLIFQGSAIVGLVFASAFALVSRKPLLKSVQVVPKARRIATDSFLIPDDDDDDDIVIIDVREEAKLQNLDDNTCIRPVESRRVAESAPVAQDREFDTDFESEAGRPTVTSHIRIKPHKFTKLSEEDVMVL
jgi:MFS family permease